MVAWGLCALLVSSPLAQEPDPEEPPTYSEDELWEEEGELIPLEPEQGEDVRQRDAPRVVQIEGRVVRLGAGGAVSDVVVAARRLAGEEAPWTEALTDEDGYFTMSGLGAGRVALVVATPDFEKYEDTIALREDEVVEVRIVLVPLDANPYEIVVRGKRPERSVTRRTLRKEELTQVPGTFGDPLRAILNLPGVSNAPFGFGAVLIRGTTPGDSGVFVDGTQVTGLYHFAGGPSVLSSEIIDQIDYYPGNFTTQFGRLSVGIIDVRSKSFADAEWGGTVDIDLFDAGAFVQGPIIENMGFALSLRRSYIDAILKGAGVTSVTPVYYDYQAKWDYEISRDHKLSFFAFGSDDQIVVSNAPIGGDTSNAQASIQTQVSFHRLKLSYEHRIGDKIYGTFSPVFGYELLEFFGDSQGSANQTYIFAAREDMTFQVLDALRLYAGIDFDYRYSLIDAKIPMFPDYRVPLGNEFFQKDAFDHKNQLLAETCFST